MNATRPRRSLRTPLNRRGFIVLVVMIVIVMITLAGLTYVMTLSTENKAVHRQGDQLQLAEGLASGMELLKAFCSQSAQLREEAGGTQDNAAAFGNLTISLGGGEQDVLQLSVVSPGAEGQADGAVRFGLQNESERLNLAVLADWEQRVPGSASAALLQLPGMTEATAAAILDWLDADGQPRSGGAEAEYYAGLGLPYEPRNGVPALLEELLLVRDVSRQALFGGDENLDYRVDAGESQSATALPSSRGDDDLPWSRLLTVTSAERNHSWAGQPRVNLNERDLKKLHAQLVEALDQPWADLVIAYRQFGPAAGDASMPPAMESQPLRDVPSRVRPSRRGAGAASAGSLDLSAPARFEIASVLDLIGVSVAVPAGAKAPRVAGRPDGTAPAARPEPRSAEGVRVLRCPLRDDSPELFDQLPRIVDLTTTTDQAVIRGRVNINAAPRCVLLGIPGLDPGTVDRILTLRTTGSDASDLARRQGLWLLTEGLVDRAGLKALWPYITGGGDVFRAQVVVQRPGSTRQARAEVVVDAAQSPPRQVYWRDLTLRGGTISEESLGRGASESGPSWSAPARQSGSSPEET